MTNYEEVMRRPLLKRLALWFLERPYINAPFVALLQGFKGALWRQRVPVIRGAGRLTLPGNAEIEMLNPARCSVAREVFWHEGELADSADRNALKLAVQLSKDADCFLDIGSYTGLFALAVARCNAQIRCEAFEIVPDNFLLLWQNVIHNDLVGRINVNFKGAGNAKGKIWTPAALEPGVLPSSVALDSATPNGIEIPVDKVDSMINIREGNVVIKIDVEGFEWDVMSGACELIENTRPDFICEFLTRALAIPAVIEYLIPLGYQFYRITGSGLVHSKAIVPVKTERDWLLTTKHPGELRKLNWTVL
jgi:FkbM family methyltransferase